jgi:hypothetical protein
MVKVKLSLLTGRGGQQGCETAKFPHFLGNRLTDGSKIVSLTRCPPFTPGRLLVFSAVRGSVDPRAIVRLEELDKLKKRLIGTRTRYLPACSIVPQPTTIPSAL